MIQSGTSKRVEFEGANMPITIGLATRTLTSAVMAVILGLTAQYATAQTVQGTAAYREHMAMPAGAVFEANSVSASIMLRRAAGSQVVSPNPGGNRPLEGTYWKATELAGKPTPTPDATREAHLLFQPAGRVSGSDGCNRFTGSYKLRGDTVTFGQMAGTLMACINASAEIDRAFREALKSATRLTVVGERLVLFDTAGNRVAVFTAGAQASGAATPLAGTSWQLVKFQAGDEKTLSRTTVRNTPSNSQMAVG